MNPTVSILTPTYDERTEFLKFVAKGICQQTYKNILEWVIVDGTRKGVSILPEAVDEIRTYKNIPKIVYVPQDTTRKNSIGNVRNIAKTTAMGEIMIHFDDDDYYPESRIEHAVTQLNNTKRQLAGASNLFMYDVHFASLYQFRSFGDDHILGGSMAYTKKYAKEHDFDESVHHAEEGSFTNNFKEPCAVLKANKVIIASSHGINTYSKKKIIWDNLYAKDTQNQTMFFRAKTLKYAVKNKKYIKAYLKVMNNSKKKLEKNFDITIFQGAATIMTDYKYYDIIHDQCIELVKRGYSIEIYSNKEIYKDSIETLKDGIVYKYYPLFDIGKTYNNLIFCGLIGFKPLVINKIKVSAKNTIILNPNFHSGIQLINKYFEEFPKMIFDNNIIEYIFRTNSSLKKYQVPDWKNKYTIINNFIPTSGNKYNLTIKEHSVYICIYYHDCMRELMNYFKYVFPILKNSISGLEFHIYNIEILEDGVEKGYIKDITKSELKEFILDKDWCNVYRNIPYSEIMERKYNYKFHFYLYDKVEMCHLITSDIKHSISIGCIPIMYKNIARVFGKFRFIIYTGDDLSHPNTVIDFCKKAINYPKNELDTIKKYNQSKLNEYSKEIWIDKFIKLLV